MDMGLLLYDKTGEDRNIEEMIGRINEVLSDYGYRIFTYFDILQFTKMCVGLHQYFEKYNCYDDEEED